MKKHYLLKANPRCQSAVVFAGFLWAATLAFTGPCQAQTLAKPDAATPPQRGAQTLQNKRKNTPTQSSGWHHFGESNDAHMVRQSQVGVWHTFGPDPRTPNVDRAEMAPRQDYGRDRMSILERQMWALLNQDRLDPGATAETGGRAQPLRWNENLAAVARAHSRSMLEQRFFDHVEPDGRTPSMRVTEAGIPWQASGENIAIYGTVRDAEGAFMNEPRFQHNHRSNILSANYTDVGIGIVQGADGSLYITQDFVGTRANSGGVASAQRPARPKPGYSAAPNSVRQ